MDLHHTSESVLAGHAPVLPQPAPRARAAPLRICRRTVMDDTDPQIRFDDDGVSNWWHDYQAARKMRPDAAQQAALLEQALAGVKAAGANKPFDSIIGLSGGVDSSYVAYLSKTWGLRPLIVHFDNGWNDE